MIIISACHGKGRVPCPWRALFLVINERKREELKEVFMKPMKKIDTYIYKLGLWAGAALSLTACVDEDLSDCPPNVEMREITVSYQIDLQHGVDPEFEAELLSLHLGFWNSPQNLYRDLVFQPEDMPEELFSR